MPKRHDSTVAPLPCAGEFLVAKHDYIGTVTQVRINRQEVRQTTEVRSRQVRWEKLGLLLSS